MLTPEEIEQIERLVERVIVRQLEEHRAMAYLQNQMGPIELRLNQIRADETAAASDEKFHGVNWITTSVTVSGTGDSAVFPPGQRTTTCVGAPRRPRIATALSCDKYPAPP